MHAPNFPKVSWTIPHGLTLRNLFFLVLFLVGSGLLYAVDFGEYFLTPQITPILFFAFLLYLALYFSLTYLLFFLFKTIRTVVRENCADDGYIRKFPIFSSQIRLKWYHLIWVTLFSLLPVALFFLKHVYKIELHSTWLKPNLGITILIIMILNYVIQFFLDDFYRQVSFYLRYFYPSILSTLILSLVIVKQEQFGTFFIDMMDAPLNLLVFTILFMVSIATVWLAPSYLYFTDNVEQYNLNKKVEKAIDTHHWFTNLFIITAQFIPKVTESVVGRVVRWFKKDSGKHYYLYNLLWNHKAYVNKKIELRKNYEPYGFSFLRLIIGISYIATLSSLIATVLLKAKDLNAVDQSTWVTMACFGLSFALFIGHQYWVAQKRAKGETLKIINGLIKGWKFNIFVFPILLLLVILGSFTNKWWGFPGQFDLLLVLDIIAVTSCIILTNVAFLYPNTKISSEEIKDQETRDRYENLKIYNRGFMAFLMGTNLTVAILAVLAFIILLLFPFSISFPWLEKINTINIYMLLVNGLIAAFTILDRYLRIKKEIINEYQRNHIKWQQKQKQNEEFTDKERETINRYKEHEEQKLKQKEKQINKELYFIGKVPARSWARILTIVGIAFYFNQQGNDYHEIPYQKPIKQTNADSIKPLNLPEYHDLFLSKMDTSQPILLVAADGGGLKAAYWTMLVLWKLDSMGLSNNIFLMSGASGGAIGEGIFTYLKAHNLNQNQIKSIIDKIGDTNFISGDLAGLFSRWPMRYIPNVTNQIQGRQDRMEAMSEFYFNQINDQIKEFNIEYDLYRDFRGFPYHYLWSKSVYTLNDKSSLPLLITNTARAEDGIKAWIHPLGTADNFLVSGVVDLTKKSTRKESEESEDHFISFPDALFLTNRFPIMSPAAKINGKGHFIDAGALDNSGLETILQVLFKMKSDTAKYKRFFDREIYVLGIRHDRDRLIQSEFDTIVRDYLESARRRSELGAFIGAVASSGISGNPKVLDEIVEIGEAKELLGITQLLKVNLPFRLTNTNVIDYFNRAITDRTCLDNINARTTEINTNIKDTYQSHLGRLGVKTDTSLIVEPPLGRLLSNPTRDYMRAMLEYPKNDSIFKRLEQLMLK